MKKVDIIIPVYNAFEYTKECIKSIIKYTNLEENRLILINDKSPDKKILPMLKEFESNNKSIVVLENEKNLGFVKTVNKGMRYSKSDVILLNSDTEVTKNWLEKMKNCAYSSDYIATVTPFTNNGTIFSIPQFGVDNDLPENIALDEYSYIIEQCSKRIYPETTTGNGFCIFIKRAVLNEIGFFDDSTFEEGYGEENDFCYRALDYGYTNVLCDDTFVYHKGTQSFTKENASKTRVDLINRHMKLLEEKYPIYVAKTNNFIANNPFKDIQENININVELHNKRKILFLVNEWEKDMEMTAGTSLHLKDIINGIINDTACFVLAPDKYDITSFVLYLYTNKCARELFRFKTDINFYGQTVYTNTKYKEILEELFKTFKFDVLHVHHLLHQTFDVIDIAKKYNVYSIITLHDLYLKCPSINMVYTDKYCELDSNKNCKECLKNKFGLKNDILDNWHNSCKSMLGKFDKIIVPSENTKKQFKKVYPNLKIDVIEHGTQIIKVDKVESEKKEVIDIAFVGVMVPHKGSKILKQIIDSNNKNIRIHLFGRADDKSLETSTSNYVYHGEYKRGDLPRLLVENKIDLVCIFAIWPETYSYTLTEVYMAKVPVLTFNIGAVGDRVKKDSLGWIIDFDLNENNIINKIIEIKNDEKGYNKAKESFNNYNFKTVEQMQCEYKTIYEKINNISEQVDFYNLIQYNKQNKNLEFEMYKNNYGHLIHRYEMMRRSIIWRLAKKIKRKIKGI